jgi:tripartite-type tricarboxylate transporter receptor subunit TctC
MFLPAATPDAVASKLQAAVVDALNDEEVKKRFNDLGAEPVGSTPAKFADYLKKEDAKWSEVVRKGNIKAD